MYKISSKEIIISDIVSYLCGEEIGKGIHRIVYQHAQFKDKVVKIEYGKEISGENYEEWRVWNQIYLTQFAKWFAPCYWISPNGRILIQKKTKIIQKFPEKMPFFFTDLKITNFGKIGNQIVCHDYSLNLLKEKGMVNKMKKSNLM